MRRKNNFEAKHKYVASVSKLAIIKISFSKIYFFANEFEV